MPQSIPVAFLQLYKQIRKHIFVVRFGLTTATFTLSDSNYGKVVDSKKLNLLIRFILDFVLCSHEPRGGEDNRTILDLQTQTRYLIPPRKAARTQRRIQGFCNIKDGALWILQQHQIRLQNQFNNITYIDLYQRYKFHLFIRLKKLNK